MIIFIHASNDRSQTREKKLQSRERDLKATSSFSNGIDDMEIRERQPGERECKQQANVIDRESPE